MNTDILEIDLSKQSNQTIKIFFDSLFKYIYELSKIKLVEHNSKLYFETSNKFSALNILEDISQEEHDRLAHSDNECTGYFECDEKYSKSKTSELSQDPISVKYINDD